MSFWLSKPVGISNIKYSNNNYTFNSSYILDPDTLLSHVEKEISSNKIQLDYHLIMSPNQTIQSEILSFINEHYNDDESNVLALQYSEELFDYYMTSNTLCALFYPKGKLPELDNITTKNMIGFLCGRPQTLFIKDSNNADLFKKYDNIDINFLCVVKNLRNLHISSHIINIMTKECLLNFNKTINCAAYTVSKKLKVDNFSKKTFYHRPLNVENLIDSDLIKQNKSTTILKKIWQTFS